MSVPSDPRDQVPPTRRQPAFPQPAAPPAAPAQPAAPQPATPPSVEPTGYADGYVDPVGANRPAPSPRLVIDTARYWAGVVATAIVAALVGVVGVVVVEQILDIVLVTQRLFSDSHTAEYAIGGAVAALAAGLLLYLLALAAPRPTAFFGWIMALGTVVAALLPLTWTEHVDRAVATGALNLVIGIAIWSLLAGVLSWTGHLRTS